MSDSTKTVELLDVNKYPKEQRQLVEDFNRKILEVSSVLYSSTEVFSRDMQRRQHRISEIIRTYPINLSNNSVDGEIYEYLDDYENPVLESMKLPCPCPMDSFVYTIADNYVVDSYREKFKEYFNRDRLLKAYEDGALEQTFEFEAGTFIGTRQRIFHKIVLSKNVYTGNVIAVCSARDISYQVETEKKLVEAQQALNNGLRVIEALANDFETILIIDPKNYGMEIYRNDDEVMSDDISRAATLGNYRDNLEKFVEIFVAQSDRERIVKLACVENVEEEISNFGVCRHKFLRNSYDGKNVYCQFTIAKTAVSSGEEKYILAIRNVDEEVKKDLRYLKQKELISAFENEQKTFRLIHKALGSSTCHIHFDEKGELTSCLWGNEFRHMLGFENEEDFPNEIESWMSRIHADDHERVIRSFWKAVDDETGNSPLNIEYRLKAKDGEIKWVHSAGGLTRREDGSPETFVNLFTDITDRKRAEHALAEQLEVVSALGDDYVNIFKVNVPERTIRIVKLFDDNTQHNSVQISKKQPYDVMIYNFACERVVPEEAEKVISALSLDVVKKRLDENNTYSSKYKAVMDDGEVHDFMFKYIKLDGDISMSDLIVGFKNIDKEVSMTKERDSLKALSETDLLSGLTNRGAGEQQTSDSILDGQGGMLCILDIDKFKSINDTFGHSVGDEVIIGVAQCLRNSFREKDIVFRLGGDEFAVFAKDVNSQELGQQIIERFFKRLEYIGIMALENRVITASVGAVIVDKDSQFSFDQLYKMADSCVYESKEVQGNKLTFFNKEDGDLFKSSDLDNDLFK